MKKNFKVLLINCNTMLDTLITAGIGILAACLKREGIEVRLFDTTFYKTREKTGDEVRAYTLQVRKTDFKDLGIFPEEGDVVEDFKKEVESYRPDLIALSCIEVTYPLGIELLSAVRHTKTPTIVGGVYATFAPHIVIREDCVDMICVGEGELAMAELCKKMRAGEDITSVQNIWIKQNGTLYKNPLRHAIDMKELPFQDWGVYDERRFWKPMGGKISVTGTFEMNRGCPYSCSFCVNSGFNQLYKGLGGYYREQDISRLIEEMQEKKEEYNLQFVYLVAESFLTTTRKRIEEFVRLYPKVGLPFWVEARPESITKEYVELLASVGCEGISVGIESGNYDLRKKVLGRDITNERIIKAFELLEGSGIRVSANNIIGFPTETREKIFDTIELNRQIKAKGVMVSFFSPYRGCTLREVCELERYLKEEDIANDYRLGPTLDMPQLSSNELAGLHKTFPLYVRFSKSEWPFIKACEGNGPEAESLYQELSKTYTEKFMK
ncbi:MAG TPA: B12-binding domain-containing radical SAM protein [Candidatus Hypogeohydataceae bacterium YC41]